MSLRVTQGSTVSLMLAGLESNQSSLSILEGQLSSGKAISKPSDNPVGTGQALQLQTDISRNTQYQTNAQDGLSWLGTADNALQSGTSILQRLTTLVTEGASTGSNSSTSLSAISTEVASLKQEMLGVANTTYLGRPIFGGNTTNTAAYVADPTTGAVTYQGDTGAVMRTVGSDTQVQVNVNAADAFGTPSVVGPPASTGNDVFSMFDQITNDLTNDPGNLSNDISLVQSALAQMSNAQAGEGAAYNRISDMNTAAGNQVTNLTGNLSDVVNVDTAQAVTNETMQQAAYQASLQAMSNILQLSLTDFLK
jgi:flagellar hook-associated protein 3 FlgL